MFRKTLFQNSFITIEMDITTDILFVNWTGEQTEETVKEGCSQMLDQVQLNKTRKVFNDNSEVVGNWSGAAEWGAKVWFPAMYAAGCQFFAWVLSKELYSQLSTQETLKYQIAGIIILNFEEREPALNWLTIM
ncbi:hypothetical protein TH61_17605 [Rufibacter sp. DG15C]|uniref:hypothetical protein n=1 Tax=Rufibacter sp. DG15C TaxID=1379909 RepID=UPI00078CBC70|nr:hypothetical protein [Rufibacter sp. DG15C]AMM52628.1 hypothetical protein TH61_17605 [Rufibacter sp. DG15C]